MDDLKNKLEFSLQLAKARNNFPYFVNHIFSQSVGILKDGTWTGGDLIDDLSQWLQDESLTIRVSARDHFKSMSFYAYIMWLILRNLNSDLEIQYFSYNAKMASYHTNKIKRAVSSNPYFSQIIDKKKTADSIISYSWNGQDKITVSPRGLLEFKRGIHSPIIFVDDPMQDPENKLSPVRITQINDIMKTQIMDMWQKELHIAGTPQTTGDFFFDPTFTKRFAVKIMPAIIDEEKKIVLWKEWMSYEELQLKKYERGLKVFNQEYMCSPVYSEEAFISADFYDPCVDKNAVNYSPEEWEAVLAKRTEDPDYEDMDIAGGFDIGKKAHPSHLVLFEYDHDKRVWNQVHSKWMDSWNYIDQLEYLQMICESFSPYVLYYDNTRGEFESFDEAGDLPAPMEPVNFTIKTKHAMATNFDKALGNKAISLLPDTRQRNQILVVNNDLLAPETKEGHGDSFWSVAMSLKDYGGGGVEVTVL